MVSQEASILATQCNNWVQRKLAVRLLVWSHSHFNWGCSAVCSEISQTYLPGHHEPLVLSIDGLKCGSCVRTVEQTLLEHPHVRQVSVNLATRTAWVDYYGGNSTAEVLTLIQALAARGFPAQLRDNDRRGRKVGSKHSSITSTWWHQWQWQKLVIPLTLLLVSSLGHLAEAGELSIPFLGTSLSHAVLWPVWPHYNWPFTNTDCYSMYKTSYKESKW